jgi:non-homologous end joining protein Ku
MPQIDDELTALQAQVDATKGVEASAKAVIDGIAAKIAAAVAAATAAGATPAELQQITDLQTALKASSDDLAASVAANP